MANTKHGLQETVGSFQVKGVVTSVEKEKFYSEIKTKKGLDMRMINFGLEFAPNKTTYINYNGMPKEDVFFSKRNKEGKNETKKVKWGARATFNEEGWKLIGTSLGLEKGEDGKNIKKTMVEFDACKEIKEKLKDDMSVFTKGKIEFSSFSGKEGKKRSVKFIPQQISLCKTDIDFEDSKYETIADFKQQIIFMGIEKQENVFVVSGKVVTYSSIEDVEFIIKDNALASMFKKNLKPYNAITVYGHISVEDSVKKVETIDDWGEADPTEKLNTPTKRDLVIIGAKGASVDKDTYTKEKIEEAIAKLNQSDKAESDWGSSEKKSTDEVEDEEW